MNHGSEGIKNGKNWDFDNCPTTPPHPLFYGDYFSLKYVFSSSKYYPPPFALGLSKLDLFHWRGSRVFKNSLDFSRRFQSYDAHDGHQTIDSFYQYADRQHRKNIKYSSAFFLFDQFNFFQSKCTNAFVLKFDLKISNRRHTDNFPYKNIARRFFKHRRNSLFVQ